MIFDSFVYCWTDTRTNKLYIGSHKGNTNDGYICSSKYVLIEYKSRPHDFSRTIVALGEWTTMRIFEDILIRKMWIDNIPCYNKGTGGMFRIDNDIRSAMSLASLGKPKSQLHRDNMKIANRAKASNPDIIAKLTRPKPPGHGAKVSAALSGKAKTTEHKESLSISQKIVAEKLRTGKTYDEIYGKEKAQQIKNKSSNTQKNRPCNNPAVVCNYCSKIGPSGAMNRWHFENCKDKI